MTVITDMPETIYHARPELSASIAKRLIEPGGPARWKWEHDHGRAETKAFDLGHAAHKLVLGVGAPAALIALILAVNTTVSERQNTEMTAAGESLAGAAPQAGPAAGAASPSTSADGDTVASSTQTSEAAGPSSSASSGARTLANWARRPSKYTST